MVSIITKYGMTLTYTGVFNLPTIPIVTDVGGGVNACAGAGGSVFVPTCRLSDTGVSGELCLGCLRDSGTLVGSLVGIP